MTVQILNRRSLIGAGALVAATGLVAGTAKAATIPSQATPTVFNFGAVGDGKTDDSGAFSAALQWSAANSRMVIVPAANYAIYNTIKFSSTTDVGATWGFQCQGALLISKITNGSDVMLIQSNNVVRYFRLAGGLSILGSGSDGNGLHLYCPGNNIFLYNFLIEGLSVEKVGKHGMLAEGNVFEASFQNCYFQDCLQNGATFADAENGVVSAITMSNCFFNQNGNYGLCCTVFGATYGGVTDVRVYGGYCRQNKSYGFYYNNGTGSAAIYQVGFENNCTSLQPGDPNGAHVYALTSMTMRDCCGFNMFGGATYFLRGWWMGQVQLFSCGQGADGQMASTGASRLVQVNGNSNGLVLMNSCSGGVAVANGSAANWRAVNSQGPSPLGNLNPTGVTGTI